MAAITILVLADPDDAGLGELAHLPPGIRTVIGQRADAFAEAASEADVILYCSGGRGLLEQVWRMAPRVRWIHSRWAGVDTLLFPALVESPVPLTNARGVFSRALGEFVVAAVLFFAKDLRRMVRSQAAGFWDPFEVETIQGQTLGIVGYGDIGRAVAQRARALGMKVLALRRRSTASDHDPFVDELLAREHLPALLAHSDYVVAAAPLTPETRGMIGPAEIGGMKRTAVLINVGRGAVVDEASLVEALEEKRIRGAALDVFEQEPLPAGHPFYRLENVLLSPHCADHTATWLQEAMRVFVENVQRFREGQPLLNPVDKRKGY